MSIEWSCAWNSTHPLSTSLSVSHGPDGARVITFVTGGFRIILWNVMSWGIQQEKINTNLIIQTHRIFRKRLFAIVITSGRSFFNGSIWSFETLLEAAVAIELLKKRKNSEKHELKMLLESLRYLLIHSAPVVVHWLCLAIQNNSRRIPKKSIERRIQQKNRVKSWKILTELAASVGCSSMDPA